MTQTICFNQNLFLVSIICFSLMIILNNYFNDKNKNNINENMTRQYSNTIESLNQNNSTSNNHEKSCNNNTINTIDALVSNRYEQPSIYKPLIDKLIDQRDKNAVLDPLTPPNRRLPRHVYPNHVKDYIFDQPTRGYPDNYHYYGNLIRREDNKIVKLYGRQTYPGSNQYDYYGITSDGVGSAEVKIPIDIPNNKELYDKDTINIDFLDISKGSFILFMNDFDKPKYNPFVIT